MSDMKCPLCKTGNVKEYIDPPYYVCDNQYCPSYDETDTSEYDTLITTRKALDESEHCCTEWEKQALDYKAENIKLSTALDVAVDALYASKTLADIAGFKMLVAGIEKALEQIRNITNDKQ